MKRATLSLVALTGSALLTTVTSSCITKGYPLGSSGDVGLVPDVAGSLYAASVGADGVPLEPRQAPYQTNVTLTMSEGGDPAYGAFVDITIQPPEALVLSPASDEAGGPSCEEQDGNFRCTGSKEGIAQFIVSSESAWSGNAHILVSWASATGKDQIIPIAPAGLPGSDMAKDFELVIADVGGAGAPGDMTVQTIQPSFVEIACTVDAKPGKPGSEWPAGKIRARQAHARVTRPGDTPEVVQNAPVLVEALDSESALTMNDPSCGSANRTSRLNLNMDATGQTPAFYLCFSDLGGPERFAVTSGVQSFERDLTVLPEPYLVRVKTILHAVPQGLSPQQIFTVDAFDLMNNPLPMTVDLVSTNETVLQLLPNTTTVTTTASEAQPSEPISVVAVGLGTAQLKVTPLLLSSPACLSDIVTVEAATQ